MLDVVNGTVIEEAGKLTFEQVVEITTEPVMIFAFLASWGIVLLIMLLLGGIMNSRTSSGKKSKWIETRNFWVAFLLWFLLYPILLLLLVIFPIWMKFF